MQWKSLFDWTTIGEDDCNRLGLSVCTLTPPHSIELTRKINASDGTDKSRKTLAARVEHYRRDLRLCCEEFEILFAPAVAKAVQNAQSGSTPLPPTFPR